MYMPYATGKPNSWGDATTFLGFFKHLLRQEYGTFLLHPDMIGTESMLQRTALYLKNVVNTQMSDYFSNQYFSSYCILVGVFVSLIRGKASGQIVVALWLFYLITFHSLSNLDLSTPLTYGVHERFWMQPNICTYFFLGIGIAYVLLVLQYVTNTYLYKSFLRILFPPTNNQDENKKDGYVESNFCIKIQQFTICLFTIHHLLSTTIKEVYPKMDQSKNNDLDVVFRSTLMTLPRESMVIVCLVPYISLYLYLYINYVLFHRYIDTINTHMAN